jgi:hypothetical protein
VTPPAGSSASCVGIAIGAAIGVAFGVAFSQSKRSEQTHNDADGDRDR